MREREREGEIEREGIHYRDKHKIIKQASDLLSVWEFSLKNYRQMFIKPDIFCLSVFGKQKIKCHIVRESSQSQTEE